MLTTFLRYDVLQRVCGLGKIKELLSIFWLQAQCTFHQWWPVEPGLCASDTGQHTGDWELTWCHTHSLRPVRSHLTMRNVRLTNLGNLMDSYSTASNRTWILPQMGLVWLPLSKIESSPVRMLEATSCHPLSLPPSSPWFCNNKTKKS